ncbi:sigma 54-interacting transcriptional regulator [Hymenobacter terricola]|uniref:sigma 54-interacting transcriptional regulator n=1 Tax=Hymenobacter terricola TaxID=2819236 RepID=UPI001B305851|nr:sigma 54-interacting transcriptional regulator [Hymenobacter terricola]
MPGSQLLLPSPAQQSILIVEDELAVANDLRQIVELAGYVVSGTAFTAAQALHLIGQHRPSLVLLDLHLKDPQGGINLAHLLNKAGVPFVLVSANTNTRILEEAKATEPYGFIVKPFRDKDVLVAVEMAQYRHARGIEVRIRQEQALQIALTDALSGDGSWEHRLVKVARLFKPFIPFSYLIMGLKNQQRISVFRACSFRRTGPDEYQTIWLREFIQKARLTWDEAIQIIDANPYDVGSILNGADFEAACQQSPLKRLLAERFELRSNLIIPLKTAQYGTFFISFYSDQAAAFLPEHLQMLERIEPSLTLTLDRLMAFEEIAAREQFRTAELTILNAFTGGQPYPAIIGQVAAALNQVISCDLFSVYRAGMKLEGSVIDGTVIKKEGEFVPFSLIDLLPKPEDKPHWQEKLDEIDGSFSRAGLYVGEQYRQLSHQNEITQFYSDSLGLQCCMIVPMTTNGNAVASLVLASRAAYAFTEKDFASFQQLSLQMSLGFENHMAFGRIDALLKQLEQENAYLLGEVKTGADFEQIIGDSNLLLNVFKCVGQVAPTDYTVLILGETGTGKELIARALHNLSARKGKALIKVNCAALPPQLIESELFGHEKGAFTGATDQRIGKFELAHGGTIFLDEIGELPLELQPKLLRVLQEKEIERIGGKGFIPCDVRIIAATNRHLQQEVDEGRFRADLFYRLNVFPIRLPALRERPEDLLPLATYFLHKIAKNLGKRLMGISEASLRQMQAYHWPGNIRELEHLLERAAIMATTPIISLVEPLMPDYMAGAPGPPPPAVKPYEQAERDNLLAALEQTNHRIRGKNGAAELLHMKPTTLEGKLARLGIARPSSTA